LGRGVNGEGQVVFHFLYGEWVGLSPTFLL